MSEPDKKEFSGIVPCGHCRNKSPMEIVHRFSQIRSDEDANGLDHGPVHELLLCPACDAITLRRGYWSEDDPGDANYTVLYPTNGNKMPLGLPASLQKPFEAAAKVKSIDPNAYGVLVGRLLELVCADRGAKGKNLSDKLSNLAERGEIPTKLVDVVKSLRRLRNVAAHATLGELAESDVPLVDDLGKAILEYVYSAPFLAKQAEDRLAQLTKPKKS